MLRICHFHKGWAYLFTCITTQGCNNEFEIGVTLLKCRMCERERRR